MSLAASSGPSRMSGLEQRHYRLSVDVNNQRCLTKPGG
jgi:hypothetical protein